MHRTHAHPFKAVVIAASVCLATLFLARPAEAQPPNDDCVNATLIVALPFLDAIDTSLAGVLGANDSSAVFMARLK